jgi:hypothetical protein
MGTSAEDQEAAEEAKKTAREAEAAEHQSRRTNPQLPDVGSTANQDS